MQSPQLDDETSTGTDRLLKAVPDRLAAPPSVWRDSYDDTLDAAERDSLSRFLKELGPLLQYLERDDVYNVNVNGGVHGKIFVEAADGKFEAPETMSRHDREALIGNIAGKCYATISRNCSRLSADMPHGFDVRVQAFCPPVSDWTLMLRKHAVRIFPLSGYRINSVPSRKPAEKPPCAARGLAAIEAAILRNDNVVYAGAMGTGKTTALNAHLQQAAIAKPLDRLLVIQDRHELKPSHRDCIQIMTRVKQAEYETAGQMTYYAYDWSDALEDALRTGSDRITWGELRDPRSTESLLHALNTGTRGMATTLHADSALDALYRLEDLLRSAKALPLRSMITRFVDMIVYMEKAEIDVDGEIRTIRQIGDIRRVMGVDVDGEYILEDAA